MKNLVKIKDTFFCGVRHCGKAMLLLVALTALSSAAWAEVGFWTESAANVHIKGWDDPVYSGGLSSSGVAIKTIEGYYSSLVFNDIWVKIWQNNSQDYMTKVQFRYWIDGKDEKNIDLSAGDWSDSNQTWYKNTEVTIYDGSKAGNHKLTFLFNGKPSYGGDCWLSNNSQNYEIDFTVPGWSTTSGEAAIGSSVVGTPVTKENISLGTHYGDSDGVTTEVGGTNAGDFTVTSVAADKITVKFTPSAVGERTATITIKDKYNKTRTLTVTGKGNFTPTVLISKSEQVNLQDVTLFGYVKYTGCKNINKVGFIISQTESEVTAGTAQVYEATTAPETIEAGSDFILSSDEFENETYYYRAWMKASDNTVTLSNEVRSFEPKAECNVTGAASILPIFKSGETTESATFTEGSASIDLTVDKNSIADVYQWNVESKPDGSVVTFSAQDKRNTTVTVNKVGQYEFTLTASCTDGTQYTSTTVLTLNVCEPAEFTQLYLDKHTNNVLCEDEEATATCITKEGFTYYLYNPEGESVGDGLAGTGATQTWRHVTGEGEFTMRTSPTGMDYCVAIVSSATQSYNTPTMEITADTDLEYVTNYQPVILSKKNVTSDTYVDTNPTWVISIGSDKGYLLNEHNRLAYDNRAREKVVFKGGSASEATITIQASAYKTVAVEDEGGDYTKQCPTTVEVDLTVKPAIDDCD